MTDKHDQQIIDLEIKLAHQENLVDELQRIVYEQDKAIAALEVKLARLASQMSGIAEGGLDIGPANERPPHY